MLITRFFLLLALMALIGCKQNSGKVNDQSEFSQLFNGVDLDGWETYIGVPEPSVEVPGLTKNESGEYAEPIGLNNDLLGVFSVVQLDGESVIRASGQIYGSLATKQDYENYHFSMQVRWGEKKWPPREDKLRNSGLLYHGTGEYGAGLGVWKQSHECQVMETMFGDSYRMGDTYCSITATRPEDGGLYVFDPVGPDVEFGEGKEGGKICSKNVTNEKSLGEWNTVEIICFGDTSLHIINGVVNMINTHSHLEQDGKMIPLTKGNIQLQSEGAEVYFKDIRIKSIDKIPEKYLNR